MKFSNTRDLIVGARLLAIGLVGLAGSAFAQKATPLPGAVQKPELKLKAPAGFMENKGQWDADALFFNRSAGQDFWVTKTGYVVDVHRFASTTRPGGHEGLAQGTEGQIMKVTFLGVNGNVTTLGTSPSKMKMDFVPIHNPELSTTGVKTYAEASVNQLYPGISAKYYLDSGMPRYDLVLDPGANPNTIRFSIDGAERSYIDKDGSLVMQSRIGDVKQTGLYAYQMINGKKVEVEASFKSIGSEGFGFRVGKFDSSKSLILDPVVYGTFMGGGAGTDEVKGITSDATGRVYVSGTTSAIDFPITVGPYGPNLTTASDGYIAVIDGDAYDQVYGAFIVGAGNADNCSFLKLDQYGNVWLSGDTNSNSFPGGAGTRTQVGFFLRFETSPTAILDPLTHPMSGIVGSATVATAITGFGILPRSTATGNVDLVWTGNTTGTVIGLGAPPAGMNGFLVRRSLTPSPLSMSAVQATSAYIGSTTADSCTGLAIGADRGIYVVGTVGTNNVNVLLTTTSTVFKVSSPTFPNGSTLRMIDCYLRKYNDNGTVAYSGVFGSSVNDVFPGAGGTGIDVFNANLLDPLYYLNSPQVAVDQLGSAYVTGIAGGFNFPKTRDAFIQTFGGGEIFVTKFNPSGTQIVYSTSLGSSRAAPTGIAVDFRGNAYVGGVVTYDLPPLPGPTLPGSIITTAGNANGQEAATDATYTGGNRTFPPPLGALVSGQDGFLTVLNNTATDLNYSSYIGGDLDEAVSGLYIDTTQSVWLSGYATSLPGAWLTPNAFKTATQPIGPPFGSDQVERL
ncbi:MAG: hypothetical protein K8R88_04000 [Armatimonadetes bacterium]|nr:hypothetical protein [Armatimonadota bacterium]